MSDLKLAYTLEKPRGWSALGLAPWPPSPCDPVEASGSGLAQLCLQPRVAPDVSAQQYREGTLGPLNHMT